MDFGQFGRRLRVGRFTGHTPENLLGRQVPGVLNFGPRTIGGASQGLILGVQFPGAASGEATFLTPAVEARLGSRVD